MKLFGHQNDQKKNQDNIDFNNILHRNFNNFVHFRQGVVRRPWAEPHFIRIGSFFWLFVFLIDAG